MQTRIQTRIQTHIQTCSHNHKGSMKFATHTTVTHSHMTQNHKRLQALHDECLERTYTSGTSAWLTSQGAKYASSELLNSFISNDSQENMEHATYAYKVKLSRHPPTSTCQQQNDPSNASTSTSSEVGGPYYSRVKYINIYSSLQTITHDINRYRY